HRVPEDPVGRRPPHRRTHAGRSEGAARAGHPGRRAVTPAPPPEPTLFGEPGGARKAQAKRGGRGAAPPSSGGPPEPAGPSAPLAARLRPRTLDELVGQQHLLGPGSVL